MMRNTFGRPDLARKAAFNAILKGAASWMLGPGYGTTSMQLQLRGIWDGYRSRLGKTVEPKAKQYD